VRFLDRGGCFRHVDLLKFAENGCATVSLEEVAPLSGDWFTACFVWNPTQAVRLLTPLFQKFVNVLARMIEVEDEDNLLSHSSQGIEKAVFQTGTAIGQSDDDVRIFDTDRQTFATQLTTNLRQRKQSGNFSMSRRTNDLFNKAPAREAGRQMQSAIIPDRLQSSLTFLLRRLGCLIENRSHLRHAAFDFFGMRALLSNAFFVSTKRELVPFMMVLSGQKRLSSHHENIEADVRNRL